MSKTILIIGAGPGIGAATAHKFGSAGWRVVLAARSLTKLHPILTTLGDAGIAADLEQVDASSASAVRDLIQRVDTQVGGLATVHYNAAVLRQAPLATIASEDIASDVGVNIVGAIAAVQGARESFIGRGGTILLTGGGLALYPNPDFVPLGIGKAGVRWLTQAMFESLKAENIHVATVTVNRIIAPGSADASGVADRLWALQSEPPGHWNWETTYPQH